MPGLLFFVPDHPQVAEQEDHRHEVRDDVSRRSSNESDRLSVAEVNDPDVQELLPDRLTGDAALEKREVRDE